MAALVLAVAAAVAAPTAMLALLAPTGCREEAAIVYRAPALSSSAPAMPSGEGDADGDGEAGGGDARSARRHICGQCVTSLAKSPLWCRWQRSCRRRWARRLRWAWRWTCRWPCR